MHTIKVNVHKCWTCDFYERHEAWPYCLLGYTLNLYPRELSLDQQEAPDWCPARDGVQIEEDCSGRSCTECTDASHCPGIPEKEE